MEYIAIEMTGTIGIKYKSFRSDETNMDSNIVLKKLKITNNSLKKKE
jgi:hypothetical protein